MALVSTDGRIVGAGAALQTMGYAIVVGAVLVRLPQTWRLWRTRSCEGVNPISNEVETFFYVVASLSGLRRRLPLAMWGENLVHAATSLATTLACYTFAKPDSAESVSRTRKMISLGALAALVLTGISGLMPLAAVGRLDVWFNLFPPLPPAWRLLLVLHAACPRLP